MINAYLVGSTLIDAGIRTSGKTILRQLGQRPLTAHVLPMLIPTIRAPAQRFAGASTFHCG
ncbi:MAG: hypothetical protein ACK4SA_12695 [Caldilinea sp.]